jgi:hypothetical protein
MWKHQESLTPKYPPRKNFSKRLHSFLIVPLQWTSSIKLMLKYMVSAIQIPFIIQQNKAVRKICANEGISS